VASGPEKGREHWRDPWLAGTVDIGHVPTDNRCHVAKTSWENASLVVRTRDGLFCHEGVLYSSHLVWNSLISIELGQHNC
jgi:hypothetical protein